LSSIRAAPNARPRDPPPSGPRPHIPASSSPRALAAGLVQPEQHRTALAQSPGFAQNHSFRRACRNFQSAGSTSCRRTSDVGIGARIGGGPSGPLPIHQVPRGPDRGRFPLPQSLCQPGPGLCLAWGGGGVVTADPRGTPLLGSPSNSAGSDLNVGVNSRASNARAMSGPRVERGISRKHLLNRPSP